MRAPLPAGEIRRLETLRNYGVVDTPPEPVYDDLAALAAQICQTPIALVSLVDARRQWFKSKVGLAAAETPRDVAFCAHTILDRDKVLEVRDAAADPRFAESDLVKGEAHIRYYAGAPLVAPDGHAVGALCVMDRSPRALSAEQLTALRTLSRQVVAQFEFQRQARELAAEIAERQRAEIQLQQQYNFLAAGKVEADRLLDVAQKSRRALLSVLEDEKRAEAEVREKAAFISNVINSLTAHIVVLDGAGKIIEANRAWNEFAAANDVPAEAHGFLGCNYITACLQSAALMKDGLAAEAVQWIRAVMAGQRREFVMEYSCDSSREQRWFLMRVSPFASAKSGVVVAHEDITERKKLEAQFRHAQKMEGIGQLAGGVAHDFNNILMIIQMQAELLRDGGDLTEEQRGFADEIGASVQRAASLTRQLLLFSRREVFQPRDMDLGEAIPSTLKMLRRLVGENIEMQLKLAPQPLFIHADAGMMDQILLNLVVNARDAMPKGGRLAIEITGAVFDEAAAAVGPARAGSFVCLSVSDTGTGIPPEILPNIFDPFFTTKDVGKGTGLGLATVFGIVQQHEGWIDVASEVGSGTTFRIYLPRLVKHGLSSGASAAQAASGGSEAILLVEDDPALRLSLRKALSQLGYRILEAPTGARALEVFKENREDIRLLLTDLVMPDGMSGIDLGKRVAREHPDVKVVYMSGYSTEVVDKDFPLKEGVNFLSKPFRPQKLAQVVRDCLDGD